MPARQKIGKDALDKTLTELKKRAEMSVLDAPLPAPEDETAREQAFREKMAETAALIDQEEKRKNNASKRLAAWITDFERLRAIATTPDFTLRKFLEESGAAGSAALILQDAISGGFEDKFEFDQKKWAFEELMKIGVGGGYKASEIISRSINVNIDLSREMTPEELKKKRDKILDGMR